MEFDLCVLTILVVFSVFIPRISSGLVKPIVVEDVFKPQEGQCTVNAQILKKYMDKKPLAEPKVESELQKKIQTSVSKFVETNNQDSKTSFIANHLAKEGGEIASWVSALVTASFAIAGVLTQASAVLGVISPGVGVISWVAGIYSSHQDDKKKEQLLQSIQNNFELINTKMDSQFKAMKDYVDDSIISSDHERLQAELNQMNLYLSDCLLIENQDDRENCLEDRCSYVKSGFGKFALFSDHLLSVEPDPNVDDETKDGARLTPVNKENAEKIIKKMSSQDVKRVFANIKTFNSYVSTVLMKCEIYRVMKKQYPKPSTGSKERKKKVADIFDVLNPKANEWNVKERVLKYLENSFYVVYMSHLTTQPKVEAVGAERDESQAKSTFKRQSKRKVQCRFKMNEYFGDTCDKEYGTDQTELKEDIAMLICKWKIDDEQKQFEKSVDLKPIIAHTNFFEFKKMLATLYAGPKKNV